MTNAAATLTATKPFPSSLEIIKGKDEYNWQVQQLTALAWQAAYTALWNGLDFTTAEKEKATEIISNFIKQGPPLKQYSELVQRILLARMYILSHPGTYAPFPSQWFAPENKNGFTGTLRWYQSVEASRKMLPAYKQSLKAFAEAIWEITRSQKATDFHYWRSYFSRQNAQATLNLFLATIANCCYK